MTIKRSHWTGMVSVDDTAAADTDTDGDSCDLHCSMSHFLHRFVSSRRWDFGCGQWSAAWGQIGTVETTPPTHLRLPFLSGKRVPAPPPAEVAGRPGGLTAAAQGCMVSYTCS